VTETTRRYERIEIELPVRLFIPGRDGLKFEAYCTSRNLGLGGLFVASSFLLPEQLDVHVELKLPEKPLAIRSRVTHAVQLEDETLAPGMGIEFLDVDAHGRETLLRYFTPQRYDQFFKDFVGEFPHLKKDLPLRDVSLVLNLWEEWKVKQEGGPAFTASGAPPATLRRPGDAEASRPAHRPSPRRPRR
jgi:hypothetical protein